MEREKIKLGSGSGTVPGVRFHANSGLNLISTGIPSLDCILSGGLPLGTVTLVEEDKFGVYSLGLTRHFVMEACLNRHKLFIASMELSTEELVAQVPKAIPDSAEPKEKALGTDDLRIAWRYKDNPSVISSPGVDCDKSVSESDVANTDIEHWKPEPGSADAYADLCSSIEEALDVKKCFISGKETRPAGSVMRVVVHGVGSAFWPDPQRSLPKLFYRLRSIARRSFSSILVTVPKSLVEELSTLKHCEHLSDFVVELNSLNEDTNPLYKEYNGLINFIKFPVINSFTSTVLDTTDWAFKVRKKKFIIEKLHLPPEMASSEQREQDDLVSCSGLKAIASQF